jgi:hypothetical protein
MSTSNHNMNPLSKWISIAKDIISIYRNEFKVVFSDRGVVIIFIYCIACLSGIVLWTLSQRNFGEYTHSSGG